jgi:uncharacterized membrane protein YeaQ/YmgE (transglycosylase-associated protein family)
MSLSVAFLLALVFGALLGLGMRQVMGNRVRLGWSEAILSGIVGSAIGALTISLIRGGYYREHWIGMLLASALGTLIVMLIVGYFTRQPHLSAAELVAAGESARVEFKSTARCNLHTGQRDDKIEMVISKTVAALANSGGGDLLIGVDDAGTALGLDDDLKFMKQPDLDRYELWLRDHLSKTLGSTASANVEVSFPVLDDKPVCHLRMLGASRPVFLSPGKGQPVQMWVRVGNSTRQLGIDEALSYAADHWGGVACADGHIPVKRASRRSRKLRTPSAASCEAMIRGSTSLRCSRAASSPRSRAIRALARVSCTPKGACAAIVSAMATARSNCSPGFTTSCTSPIR